MVRRYVFDTSALVKLYVVEPDSRTVRDMLRSARVAAATTQVIVCDFVLPETIAALQQILRSQTAARRGMSPAAFRRAVPQVWDDLTKGTPLLVLPAWITCTPLHASSSITSYVRRTLFMSRPRWG